MKIAVFPSNSSIAGRPIFQAFIESLKGETVIENDMDCDVAVIWSQLWAGRMKHNEPIWRHYRSQGKPVIILEVGSIKRNETWKVGINGINGGAIWPDADGPTRFDLAAKPWRESDSTDPIILCGQHGHSEQWRGMPPMDEWMRSICSKIRVYTNRKIIIRPHPRFNISPDYIKGVSNVLLANPKHIEGSYDDFNFEDILRSAHCVICHSSGPGVVSVLGGVPAFVSPNSMAYSVAMDINELEHIENPSKPNRDEWVNTLSYTEWTVAEIASGEPWKRLKDKLS